MLYCCLILNITYICYLDRVLFYFIVVVNVFVAIFVVILRFF